MKLAFNGLKQLIDNNEVSNTEFDTLEEFINSNINKDRYSKDLINKAIDLA
jgi:hypothetical protein